MEFVFLKLFPARDERTMTKTTQESFHHVKAMANYYPMTQGHSSGR